MKTMNHFDRTGRKRRGMFGGLVLLVVLGTTAPVYAKSAQDAQYLSADGQPLTLIQILNATDAEFLQDHLVRRTQAAEQEAEHFNDMVRSICARIILARANSIKTISDDIELSMLKFNGWDRQTPNYQRKLSEFFNANSDKFICEHTDDYSYDRQHLFKRIVRMTMYKTLFLEGFFLRDENLYPIDVNFVGENARNGEPETLLDFLDDILADPDSPGYNRAEIYGLRELITEFYNAKKAKELQ